MESPPMDVEVGTSVQPSSEDLDAFVDLAQPTVTYQGTIDEEHIPRCIGSEHPPTQCHENTGIAAPSIHMYQHQKRVFNRRNCSNKIKRLRPHFEPKRILLNPSPPSYSILNPSHSNS
jgi:hypothetical protein